MLVTSRALNIKIKSSGDNPPSTANAASTSVLNEMMILSFGYFDPLKMGESKVTNKASTEGPLEVEAPVFVQAALPRSVFIAWMTSTLRMMGDQKDRENMGWSEVLAVIESFK